MEEKLSSQIDIDDPSADLPKLVDLAEDVQTEIERLSSDARRASNVIVLSFVILLSSLLLAIWLGLGGIFPFIDFDIQSEAIVVMMSLAVLSAMSLLNGLRRLGAISSKLRAETGVIVDLIQMVDEALSISEKDIRAFDAVVLRTRLRRLHYLSEPHRPFEYSFFLAMSRALMRYFG